MRFRKLRIAFSATCLIACVLLIVLSVRSYWWMDSTTVIGHDFTLWGGQLFLDEGFHHMSPTFNDVEAQTTLRRFCTIDVLTLAPGEVSRYGTGWMVSLWELVGVTAVFVPIPWMRWRFSLRTLLITTTLVAVGLGLIVWAARRV
jgi:hypothetical protein